MKGAIYSDWALDLLVYLAEHNPAGTAGRCYVTARGVSKAGIRQIWDDLQKTAEQGTGSTDLDDQLRRMDTFDLADLSFDTQLDTPQGNELKRAWGGKSDKPGWNEDRDYRLTIKIGLIAVTRGYPGPRLIAQTIYDYLAARNFSPEDLWELKTMLSRLAEKWESSRPYDESAWQDISDFISTRLVRERSDYPGKAKEQPSVLCLVRAVLADEAAEVFRRDGTSIRFAQDGKGPVDQGIPKSDAELLARVLPDSAIRALCRLPASDGELGAVEAAHRLLTSAGFESLAPELARWFEARAGHGYAQMIESARDVLTLNCDYDLLRGRLSKLFMSEIAPKSPRANWVVETWSEIQQCAHGDPARLLSCMVLSLIFEPENFKQLRFVVRGGWFK